MPESAGRGGRIGSAHALAFVAILLALGGTGYAISKLPKGSVGPKQLQRDSVSTRKVRNRSLKAKDFKAGQLPRGPRGAKGATGPAGPSHVYQDHTEGSIALPAPLGLATLASLTVPAGSYVFSAQAVVDNNGAGTGKAICFLVRPDNSYFGYAEEGLDVSTGFDDIATVSFSGATTFGATTTIEFQCARNFAGSDSISASERRLVAIKVGALTNQ